MAIFQLPRIATELPFVLPFPPHPPVRVSRQLNRYILSVYVTLYFTPFITKCQALFVAFLLRFFVIYNVGASLCGRPFFVQDWLFREGTQPHIVLCIFVGDGLQDVPISQYNALHHSGSSETANPYNGWFVLQFPPEGRLPGQMWASAPTS